MTSAELVTRLRSRLGLNVPLPGCGNTPLRHKIFMGIGLEDLGLARLAEAHWDAVAILAEARLIPVPGALYGVWASEIPGAPLTIERSKSRAKVSGTKKFCSGAGLIDRALITVDAPEPLLVELDVRPGQTIHFDYSDWKTAALVETCTATAIFNSVTVADEQIVGDPGWYLDRVGFWHGACGPAACWAGGAAGLLAYAVKQSRSDPHTLAHLGAMSAAVWAMRSFLDSAGFEIDQHPNDSAAAKIRALTVRHLIEQASTDILRRLLRAFGPHPLAFNEIVGRRYRELDLYLRQSHAERDLEDLGSGVRSADKR